MGAYLRGRLFEPGHVYTRGRLFMGGGGGRLFYFSQMGVRYDQFSLLYMYVSVPQKSRKDPVSFGGLRNITP